MDRIFTFMQDDATAMAEFRLGETKSLAELGGKIDASANALTNGEAALLAALEVRASKLSTEMQRQLLVIRGVAFACLIGIIAISAEVFSRYFLK
jgi:hypothetical protein